MSTVRLISLVTDQSVRWFRATWPLENFGDAFRQQLAMETWSCWSWSLLLWLSRLCVCSNCELVVLLSLLGKSEDLQLQTHTHTKHT